ncbi:MAG TPA: hypothetical protein VHD87_08130 [Acidimicrobiales bacterium]|nr:hypothetical protein [Acidimicrobiales bacterium]
MTPTQCPRCGEPAPTIKIGQRLDRDAGYCTDCDLVILAPAAPEPLTLVAVDFPRSSDERRERGTS